MKKRTLNIVPPLPAEEYVPPSEMYPNGDTSDVTPNGDIVECSRCLGPLVNGSPLFFLKTDVRIYHFHRDCPEEIEDHDE